VILQCTFGGCSAQIMIKITRISRKKLTHGTAEKHDVQRFSYSARCLEFSQKHQTGFKSGIRPLTALRDVMISAPTDPFRYLF